MSSIEDDLRKLKRDINDTKKKIKVHDGKETSLLLKLNKLDKKLDTTKRELQIYEYNLAQNEKDIKKTNEEIQKLETRIERSSIYLKGRLRAMYKSGGVGFLRALFSARSLSEILQKITLMRYIAYYDADFLVKLKLDRTAYLQKQEELEDYKNRVNKYKKGTVIKKDALLMQQEERRCLLDSVRKDKNRQRYLLKEMEKRSEELRKLLISDNRYKGSSNFERLKGTLIWPVKGDLSATFGFHYDSVLNRKILNNGVRIKAPLGTNILSIAPGKVIYADWFCGYGKLIIIDHGEGYNSVYAHTSELFVKKGATIKEGERVAVVGDTDSIRGAELYFEIRFNGRPVDPVVWLRPKI